MLIVGIRAYRPTVHPLIYPLAVLWIVSLYAAGCSTTGPPPISRSPGEVPADHGQSAAVPPHARPYRVGNVWYFPMASAHDFSQQGIASWYGKKFHGRKTSSGEIYDMFAMTAAHKTLPLGTSVKVRNLQNGKEVHVRINDRGPFVRGRIIDLSYTAARKIGIAEEGTGPVEVVALGRAVRSAGKGREETTYEPLDYSKGNFTIQVGSFLDHSNATRLRDKLDSIYKNAHITTFYDGGDTLFRVRVGRCTTLSQAQEYEQILVKSGFEDAMIVAE